MKSKTVTLKDLQKEIKTLADPQRAKASMWFFKTGKGEYGEGDVFVGLALPITRKLVTTYQTLPLSSVKTLLKSKIHEERLLALLILVAKFEKEQNRKKTIVDFYLQHTKYINNWDLVDSSAYKILGPYLEDRSRMKLYRLAKSSNMWERRIAIISTMHFIRNIDFNDTLKIAEILLHDKEDLLHKAVGWMLREVGNRSLAVEEGFLKKHYKTMPRTMLRYAIEKFPQKKREFYLKKT